MTQPNSPPRPPLVVEAHERVRRLGFELSSDETVGQLLAVLAGAVPPGGKILELGTGAGVGLAWLAHGVGTRSGVEIVSVETDTELHREVSRAEWPPFVTLEIADGAEFVSRGEYFDLIFADAEGGKIENLDGTIESLKAGGILIVDDMDLELHDAPEEADLQRAIAGVREQLLADARILTVELEAASGIILCTRRGA